MIFPRSPHQEPLHGPLPLLRLLQPQPHLHLRRHPQAAAQHRAQKRNKNQRRRQSLNLNLILSQTLKWRQRAYGEPSSFARVTAAGIKLKAPLSRGTQSNPSLESVRAFGAESWDRSLHTVFVLWRTLPATPYSRTIHTRIHDIYMVLPDGLRS